MRKNQLVLLDTNDTVMIDTMAVHSTNLHRTATPLTRRTKRPRTTTPTLTVVLDGEEVAALEQQLFHLDDSTRVIGFSGIAAARAALRHAQPEAA
jgi:hypothetical protein